MVAMGIDAGGTRIRIKIGSVDNAHEIRIVEVAAAPDGGPEPVLAWLGKQTLTPTTLVAGITKFSRSGIAIRWQNALSSHVPADSLEIHPDWRVAHAGAFRNHDGVLVISGTGSVAIGKRGAQWSRVGGRGWEYGDEGSGAHVTTEAIRRTIRSLDSLSVQTPLHRRLAKEIGTEDAGIFAERCRARAEREGRGFLVPVIVQEASDGVDEAIDLLRGCAGWLARITWTTVREAGFPNTDPVPICTVGGMFDCGPWIGEGIVPLVKRRLENAMFTLPLGSPVDGAWQMATSLLPNDPLKR